MERNRLSFLSIFSYVTFTTLIIFSTSFFLFACSANNIIISLLLSFPYALILTIYIIFIIYDHERQFKSIVSLIIFLLSYLVALMLINLSTTFDAIFWFYFQLISVIGFSMTWLTIRLIRDIKINKKEKIHLSSYFVPFVILFGYVSLLMTNLPFNNKNNNQLLDNGLEIYNKIYEKINTEVKLEGNQLHRIKLISYEEECLRVGYLTNLSSYYNVTIFNYSGFDSANKVFENILSTNSFPSYTKQIFLLDENVDLNITMPSEITNLSNEILEASHINYIDNEQAYVDALVKYKQGNTYKYASFNANKNETATASVYIYEGIGEYVVRNLEKAR